MAALPKFGIGYLYSQLFVTPSLPTTNFDGQTIIVTGSNSGIGFEAARHFVRLKATLVILAVRDRKSGQKAKESITASESTHRPDIATCIQIWELDLARYDSVKAFAKRVEGLERVDKVVENAGIYPTTFQRAVGGDELSVTVNVISTFLLALLLLPKLRESGKRTGLTPILSVTGSFVHWFTQFKEQYDEEGIFKTLADEHEADIVDRYNVTKMMQLYIIRELASLISASPKEPKVIVNISNPGFCRSNIMREATGSWKLFIDTLKVFLSRTTEVGGRTVVAGVERGKESHGKYLNDCQVGTVAPTVDGENGVRVQKRLWEELSRKFEAIQPGILSNI